MGCIETGDKPIHVYRVDEAEALVAAIPRGHLHTRFALVLRDQVIVFPEAVAAAIARAYMMVASHPTRRGIVMAKKELPEPPRKHGFAKHQLVELEECGEEDAVMIIERLLENT